MLRTPRVNRLWITDLTDSRCGLWKDKVLSIWGEKPQIEDNILLLTDNSWISKKQFSLTNTNKLIEKVSHFSVVKNSHVIMTIYNIVNIHLRNHISTAFKFFLIYSFIF